MGARHLIGAPGRRLALVSRPARLLASLPARPSAPPRWLWLLLAAGALTALGWYEVRTSALEAWLLSRYAAGLSWRVAPGPSPSIAFPRRGPFDERRGYTRLPEWERQLVGRGWRIVAQARQSAGTVRLVAWGVSPPYAEPAVTGLVVRAADGRTLYDARPDGGAFARFDDVPPVVVATLLFLENRDLAHATGDRLNPAVDWRRLVQAGARYGAARLGLPVRVAGGSTLATQLEKYRHSADGRTASPLDKLRQLAGASLKAYRDGPDTRDERRQVVVDYLNTMPLAAAPGWGEVWGLGAGLRAWFGLDPPAVMAALRAPGAGEDKARAFKHVLALLYAVRAPTYFLAERRDVLERRLDAYAGLLAGAGVIDPALARRVRALPLAFAAPPAGGRDADFAEHKAAATARQELRALLDPVSLYDLDRLHLEVETTVDGRLQEAVTRLLRDLRRPEFVRAHGLDGERMLTRGDPRRLVWSFLLYERAPEGDLLRVRADTLDAPFDVNGGMKLELGSTAKLRTAAHYLEVMAGLHAELAGLGPAARAARAREARDPLTRWAAETLAAGPELDLDAFLARALDRTYSAHPGEVFYTGGGVHTFRNFDRDDDGRVLTVRQALARSVNLVFVRLLRDLVRFHEARLPYDTRTVLEDPADPTRHRLLAEIAEEEARQVLLHAWRRSRGLAPAALVARVLRDRSASHRAQATLFFAWHPGADAEALGRWLAERGAAVTADEARALARAYGSPRLTLRDVGYLLGRHPLEVWAAGQLARQPDLAWPELWARSAEARRAAMAWLFETRNRAAQDLRLRARIERDAFARMARDWRRLGFPFDHLVPSLATALGASADRPTALAELMGVILSDGVRRPRLTLRRLRFAGDTPYETVLEPAPGRGRRVLHPAVARALRTALAATVEGGTARLLRGAFVGPDGTAPAIGGKTGSGDNRFETFARGGALIASRPVSRTGAFVFYIGDRYYGVITASVAGPAAEDYRFTSALPLAALRLLAPEINARLAAGPGDQGGVAGGAAPIAARGREADARR